MHEVHQCRRIAHWQSTSKHTEGEAAFESCSAYHSSRDLLFLSHCVPNPPDKGERIRAFHLLNHLAARFRVHLACFARDPAEREAARELSDRCASIYVEPLGKPSALARAFGGLVAGRSLTASCYRSPAMRKHILQSLRFRPFATFAFSSAMAQHAPSKVPLVVDFVDVDSEKWLQYGLLRKPGFLYSLEGRRLRALERSAVARSRQVFLSTEPELRLLSAFAPAPDAQFFENGVDARYFDPALLPRESSPSQTRRLVFVGAMDYYPNVDACHWFATEVLPVLRGGLSDVEFWVVGRNPAAAVRQLGALPGVKVVGATPDVRPYLQSAYAVVAPLRIARGVQNKVLEALAMGKPVLASPAVAACFGSDLPPGIITCDSPAGYAAALAGPRLPHYDPAIRLAAVRRFSWEANMHRVSEALESIQAAQSELHVEGVRP